MKIIDGWPPLIDEIDKAFNVRARRDVVYAWLDTIYAPGGQRVPPQIVAHEMVHGDRQRRHPGGVEGWWRNYILSEEFRLFEEIPAHYAEYRWLVTANPSRHGRRRALTVVSHKLASKLYGNMITIATARALLEMGPEGAKAKRHLVET